MFWTRIPVGDCRTKSSQHRRRLLLVKCASMTCVGLFGSGDQCGCRPAFQSQLNYRWLRGAKKWVTPDWDSQPRVLGGLTVPAIPVISSRPRVLGDATAAVVWFSSPFFPVYIVPQLRLINVSRVSLIWSMLWTRIPVGDCRTKSSQRRRRLLRCRMCFDGLRWPFWVGSPMRLPAGFPVSTRWLSDKKGVTPNWDSESSARWSHCCTFMTERYWRYQL